MHEALPVNDYLDECPTPCGVVPATSHLPNRQLHHLLHRDIVSILQHRSRSQRN